MSGGGSARYWPSGLTDDVIGTVMALDVALSNVAQYQDQKAAARELHAFLANRVASPPTGVRVRKPAGGVRYVFTVVAVIILIVVAIFGVMWLVFG